MMLSKPESGKNSDAGNSSNAQLLRDIEEISRALYLHKTIPKDLLPPSQVRSQSAGKTRLLESKSSSNPKFPRDDLLYRDKKSSSSWNWKKPLKALTHIGNRKFSCCFYLHVHSIEGLPANFDGFSLCVNWKRKDEVLRTHPSKVFQGMVEIDETMMHRCSVYGSKSGAHHSAKYDAKFFLISISVIGAPGLDIGKHWVDLTRLLPLTLEELEGEKSSGKWMTSFKLTGKADGASLNFSFGYTVMADYFLRLSGKMDVSKHINLGQNRSRTMENSVDFQSGNDNGMLHRGGSLRNNLNLGSVPSLQSIERKIYHEVLFNPELELSKSINFLYQELGEESLLSSVRSNSEDVKPLKPKPDIESECDNIDFTIVERGIEMPEQEELQSDQATVWTIDGSVIETINVDEIIKDDDISIEEKTNCNSKDDVCGDYLDEVVMDDYKYDVNSLSTRESTVEEAKLDLHHLWSSESAKLDPPQTTCELLEDENMMEVISHYQDRKIVNKSSSLDDVTKTVARDFLNLLGMEHGSSRWTSESDAESPRECLLRQFEKDALASDNFNIYFDEMEEQSDFSCTDPPWSSFGECFEDSDLSSIIQAAEEEHNREGQLLRNRRKAKILEDMETEALMQEWGLNEDDFESSPRNRSGGFGSPIQLAPAEPLELPPLGVGLVPFVWTKGGGFLRSMSPSLFRNAKNGGSLIMQVSSPVVLPAAMGYDIMEILQHLASVGTEKMSLQANQLMPLVDLTGKMIEELVRNAASSLVVTERQALLQHELVFWLDAYGSGEEVEGCPSGWSCKSGSLGLTGGLDYASLKELVPLAMDKVEALSIEGLRIQTGMSDEEVPSSINSNFGRFHRSEGSAVLKQLNVSSSGSDVDRLLGLSLTLDDWLRLDAGIIGDEDQDSERLLEILAAHHANCTDFVSEKVTRDKNWDRGSGLKHGLLGNNLIVAFMLQLRDPLRNHEPVGVPMLALLHVERVVVPPMQRVDTMVVGRSNNEEGDPKQVLEGLSDVYAAEKNKVKEEDSIPRFKIAEVQLAGVSSGPGKRQFWGTATQRQSGCRWLLGSGMAKTNKQPLSKSKAIVISSPLVRTGSQSGDILWSISSRMDCMRSKSANSHIRNPNIIFPDETIRSLAACNF